MPSPFGDIIQQQIDQAGEAFLKKNRPAEAIRKELDIAYRTKDLNLFIVEIRPVWNNPSEIMETPLAKATFVKSKGIWKVFWMLADLKWYAYPEQPQVKTVVEFFDLVDEDRMHCFFGVRAELFQPKDEFFLHFFDLCSFRVPSSINNCD